MSGTFGDIYTVLTLPGHTGLSEPFSAIGNDCSAGLANAEKGTIPAVPSMFTGPIVPTGQGSPGHWVEYPWFGITPPKGPVGSR